MYSSLTLDGQFARRWTDIFVNDKKKQASFFNLLEARMSRQDHGVIAFALPLIASTIRTPYQDNRTL